MSDLMKQFNIKDKNGVIHQFEVKDAEARQELSEAKELDFNSNSFEVTETEDTISISANVFKGASDSKNSNIGFVPSATIAQKNDFLRADGTWAKVELADKLDKSLIASDYSTTRSYTYGDVVFKDNKLYRCLAYVEAGEFNADYWKEIILSDDLTDRITVSIYYTEETKSIDDSSLKFVGYTTLDDDFIGINASDKNYNPVFSGMLINANAIRTENAGKILKIDDEGKNLSFADAPKGGLSYKIKEITNNNEQDVSLNCDYDTLTDLKLLPADIINLTLNLPEQPNSDNVYHAMIQFTCNEANKLANIILKYGEKYFNVYKIPTSYLDKMVYQIIIYNDCATILPFGDTTVKKKHDIEQEWILNEYSELLHYFKDTEEIHNATPVDSGALINSITNITTDSKLGIGYDKQNLSNNIIKITSDSKVGIGYDNYNLGSKIININTVSNLGICYNNYSMSNSIVNILDIEEEI